LLFNFATALGKLDEPVGIGTVLEEVLEKYEAASHQATRLDILKGDEEWAVHKAIDGLTAIGTNEAFEHLAGFLQHKESKCRRLAVSTLGTTDWQPKDDIESAWLALAREDWKETVRLA